MRFAEQNWKVVPVVDRNAHRHVPHVRIMRDRYGNQGMLRLNASAYQLLGTPAFVRILICPRGLAIGEADRKEQGARKVPLKTLQFNMTPLIEHVLRLQPKESFPLPVELDAGYLVAELPAEVVKRMQEGRSA